MIGPNAFSVIIPTVNRGNVLLDTISRFAAECPRPAQIIVIDQTAVHPEPVRAELSRLAAAGVIQWIRSDATSQPAALNEGARRAFAEFVLFVDDDIVFPPGLLAAHRAGFVCDEIWAVAGGVLQPGEIPTASGKFEYGCLTAFANLEFPFKSSDGCFVGNGMSGNLAVRRERFLELGGFDENFFGPVSYRFDAEFCSRLTRAGGKIWFEPRAVIHHLRAPRGGTRSLGSHLTSASPVHGMGDYYFAFREGWSLAAIRHVLRRPVREVATRFHLRRPWWIPVKLVGEARAMFLAYSMSRRGPRLLDVSSTAQVGLQPTSQQSSPKRV